MHPRTEIRHAVAALLSANSGTNKAPIYPTSAGRNIYVTRTAPLSPRNMPAITIHTGREVRDSDANFNQTGDEHVTRRILFINIEAAVSGQNANDDVDTLCGEVEDSINASPNLGGKVESITWQRTALEPAGDGQAIILVALMEFQVAYYTTVQIEPGVIPTQILVNVGGPFGPDYIKDYEEIDKAFLPENT